MGRDVLAKATSNSDSEAKGHVDDGGHNVSKRASTSQLRTIADKKRAEKLAAEGPMVAYQMSMIMGDYGSSAVDLSSVQAEYRPELKELAALKYGYRNYAAIPGREKKEMFDRIASSLAPAIPYDSVGGLQEQWSSLRESVDRSEARDRVDHSIAKPGPGGATEAIEIPDDAHPKEQAALLRTEVPEILKVAGETVERAKNLSEKALGEEAHTFKALENAASALTVVNGMLKLSDDEFMKEVKAGKIGSITELVKTVVETSGKVLQLTMSGTAFLMKTVGEHAMAEALEHGASKLSGGLTRIVAGFELVHGLLTVFDSSKTREERIDGGAEAAMGLAVLVTGESIAALPIGGPYAMIKIAAHLYREAAVGWEVGFLRELFSWMGEQGQAIAREGEALAIASDLAAKEKDPARKIAMQGEEKARVATLASSCDAFLERCTTGAEAHHGIGDGDVNMNLSHYPGNFGPVAEVFAPIMNLRGSKTGPTAANAGTQILAKITWCFQHGDALARGSAARLNLKQIIKAEEDEKEEAAKKKREE